MPSRPRLKSLPGTEGSAPGSHTVLQADVGQAAPGDTSPWDKFPALRRQDGSSNLQIISVHVACYHAENKKLCVSIDFVAIDNLANLTRLGC